MSGTEDFFRAMAPHLTANLLTVTFLYCVARVTQMEHDGEKGRVTPIWVAAMVLMFTLYGIYLWEP